MEKRTESTMQQRELKSKKDMILSLFNSGVTEIETISAVSGARPSYVGAVLHREGLVDNYFDLYTSTGYPMNVYSNNFVGSSVKGLLLTDLWKSILPFGSSEKDRNSSNGCSSNVDQCLRCAKQKREGSSETVKRRRKGAGKTESRSRAG